MSAKQVLARDPASGRADLHMHTRISDGVPTIGALLAHIAQNTALNVIAVTDHDRLEASLWAYERRHQYPFDVVPGVEITSIHGHILGLWVTRPVASGMSLAETVAAIHEQGGIAALAHPFHVHMGLIARSAVLFLRRPELLLESGLDALEAHNAGILTPGSNLAARRFAARLGLAVLGNSDAHTSGAVGSGWTGFVGSSGDDLRTAIRRRQTQAHGGSWPLPEYGRYVRGLVQRRGKVQGSVSSELAPEGELSPDAP